ncbi:Uncharacterised protein [Mycobacteroides abscessus]|nr:Uncharacterised protein [Mycobacteroides abscessus]
MKDDELVPMIASGAAISSSWPSRSILSVCTSGTDSTTYQASFTALGRSVKYSMVAG